VSRNHLSRQSRRAQPRAAAAERITIRSTHIHPNTHRSVARSTYAASNRSAHCFTARCRRTTYTPVCARTNNVSVRAFQLRAVAMRHQSRSTHSTATQACASVQRERVRMRTHLRVKFVHVEHVKEHAAQLSCKCGAERQLRARVHTGMNKHAHTLAHSIRRLGDSISELTTLSRSGAHDEGNIHARKRTVFGSINELTSTAAAAMMADHCCDTLSTHACTTHTTRTLSFGGNISRSVRPSRIW
jgi:hypothetical protein